MSGQPRSSRPSSLRVFFQGELTLFLSFYHVLQALHGLQKRPETHVALKTGIEFQWWNCRASSIFNKYLKKKRKIPLLLQKWHMTSKAENFASTCNLRVITRDKQPLLWYTTNKKNFGLLRPTRVITTQTMASVKPSEGKPLIYIKKKDISWKAHSGAQAG